MKTSKLRVWATLAAVAVTVLSASANAQRRDRSGTEVVNSVCAACHATGDKGAPRIGDQGAWAKRSALGLTALTEHALAGIRGMPAHGGNPGLSDVEVGRAITHMVNQSGGHWIEPLAGATPAGSRQSEQIVQMHCAKCHQDGSSGAPKIGDRAAWVPRMKIGLDALVKSAVHGHGPMPARGGVADLSDPEIRDAVIYMFNYGAVALPPGPGAPASGANPYRKVVDGMEVYLGVVRAEALPAGQLPGKAPRGKGYYHVNISLLDANTKLTIADAQVKVKVADPIGLETKHLEVISTNSAISYGGYFHMAGLNPYSITAEVQRPTAARASEARFEYKAR